MTFDRKTMVFPDSTRFEEYEMITKGDVVISDDASFGYGIRTEDRIFVGERAYIKGNLNAKGDIMIDSFSRIEGNVSSGGNVYLGERVFIDGKLRVNGDLDVGNDVQIKKGFEAKGLINIRSPIPVIIYIFIYIIHLLKLGKSEEIEHILEELEKGDNPIPVSKEFTFIPTGAIVGDKSKAPAGLKVGKNCKIVGNFDTGGEISIGEESTVYGSLSGTSILIGKGTEIYGNLSASGTVNLGEDCRIKGNIYADIVYMSKSAVINGTVIAKRGVVFGVVDEKMIEEKLKRFNEGIDIVSDIEKLME